MTLASESDGRLVGGRYRLTRVLGRGGMGTVWAGRDEVLGRDVAVKELLPPQQLPDDELRIVRERSLREARAAARISHPGAVVVYDVVEEDDRPWIVMQQLHARSLAEILRDDGPLTPVHAARIGIDIVEALHAAHAAGVLHRDVKPANVMITDEGAVLTDFGIATLDGDPTITATGLVLGSPAYMSPERARGEAPTAASDLWSLGVTLYTAVTGTSPFQREGHLPTLGAVLNQPAAVPPAAGPLAPVLERLLAKDPAERPDADIARTMLELAASAPARTAMTATPPDGLPPPRRLPEPSRRGATFAPEVPTRQTSVVVAAVAVIAVLAGVIAAIVQLSGGAGQPSGQGSASSGAGPASVTAPAATPRPSAQASSSAPAASSPAAGVPTGFRLYRDPTGFAVAVPDGWRRSTDGSRTTFREPGGARFLTVDQTTTPADDALKDWRRQEKSAAKRLSGYERVSLERVSYRGWDAADWEFTWRSGGRLVHVLNRNVRVSDQRAYALYWSVPADEWAASRPLFDTIAASFSPAS